MSVTCQSQTEGDHAPCRSCNCPDADTAYYVLDGNVLHTELLCGRHRDAMARLIYVRLLGEAGTDEAEEGVAAWLAPDAEDGE